jgi:hypothetical protein
MSAGIMYLTTLSVFNNDPNNDMYSGIIVSATEAYYVGSVKRLKSTSTYTYTKVVAYIMTVSSSSSCLSYTDSTDSGNTLALQSYWWYADIVYYQSMSVTDG